MIVNHVVKIALGYCNNTFGTAPCTATNAVGFECFNTKATCQDEPNYTATTKTYSFSESNNAIFEGAIPCVESIEFAPTEINFQEALDYLGKVNIVFRDFAHNDISIDPYYDTRPYIATDQGTFWGKYLARNPHYFGRELTIEQYVDGVLGETYTFLIETISHPSSDGMVNLVARDPLFLTGSDYALAPKPSQVKLVAAATDSATTLSVDDVTNLASSGSIRIGSEIIDYTATDGIADTITGCTRGQWGTTAASHAIDDEVQECLAYSTEPMIDVVNDLLANYTSIDPTYIPYTDWEAEETDWLAVYTLTNIISEPTPVLDLLTQIQRETGVNIWWSQREKEIRLKAAVPRTQNSAVETLTDRGAFRNRVDVTSDDKLRRSQFWMYYGVIDYTEGDDTKNFRNREIRSDLDSEDSTEYGTEAIDITYCRWLTGLAQVGQVASRRLSRYQNPSKTISFALAHKDASLHTGDHFFIESASIQDKAGAPLELEMQMLSMRYIPNDATYECKAQTFAYIISQFFAFVAPDSTPVYLSASTSERESYGFISDDSGEMSNGDPGYLII